LTGEALRRTPCAAADEVAEAAAAAQAAAPAWAAQPEARRQELLQDWATELDQYTGHFAKLVRQEIGKDEAWPGPRWRPPWRRCRPGLPTLRIKAR